LVLTHVLFGYALFYQLLTTFVVKPSNTWIYQRPCLPFRTKASDKAELRILVHYDHRPVAKVDEEKIKRSHWRFCDTLGANMRKLEVVWSVGGSPCFHVAYVWTYVRVVFGCRSWGGSQDLKMHYISHHHSIVVGFFSCCRPRLSNYWLRATQRECRTARRNLCQPPVKTPQLFFFILPFCGHAFDQLIIFFG
jgi:hypothetical protein